MKQLLILSGKGGTGKTTLASAFVRLSQAKAYADCDVDAPNLHLVLAQEKKPSKMDYYGMPKAKIEQDRCIACGQCMEHCRFQAISDENGYSVNLFACEGCGVCEAVCPANAIMMQPVIAGEQMLYADDEAVFSTARLNMGNGTTGKLVTEVKKQMLAASSPNAPLAIIDGSPGIGCPVIASMSGVTMTLIVAEPSVSGISDMERILHTAGIFKTPVCVCVNKADTNKAAADRIEQFCRDRALPFVGRIPYDPEAVKAINSGLTVVDIKCPAGDAVRVVFSEVMRQLGI